MTDFTMPSLGADMDAGTLVEWKVRPGDVVHRGDIVAVVDTQKAAIEVEIFADGVIDEILVEPGVKVPVGTVLARVREPGEREAAPPAKGDGGGEPRLRITPSARKRARELGVDPHAIARGTGPHGSIVRRDVEAAATPAPVAEPAPVAKPMAVAKPAPAAPDRRAALRAAIAAAMAKSKREIPHYYLADTFDVEPLMAWLAEVNAARAVSERLLPGAVFLAAVAKALWDVPEMNGSWVDGAFRPSEAVHLGVAISLRGGGVIAPALHDAADKSLDQLMADLRDLVARARAGTLRSSELTDATITVTSLGDRGPEVVHGVIYPPQVALVGFGAVVRRPWIAGDEVVPRRIVTVTLAADHRASDGHRGGLFLAAIGRYLSAPETL